VFLSLSGAVSAVRALYLRRSASLASQLRVIAAHELQPGNMRRCQTSA